MQKKAPLDVRRKNLSSLSIIDPSPKQGRKSSIQFPRQKENIPMQEDLKKQISALIRKTPKQKKKLECEEIVEIQNRECPFDEQTIRYLYQKEQDYRVNQNFYEHLTITPLMRSILIDWIMEVCKEFTLKRETFHLTVINLDRYLTKVNVSKSELQLVGLACLYISCKIEEIYPPKVSDFSQASNYGFTTQQIMQKELHILQTLKWLINPPTLYLWSTWYLSQWDLYYKGLKQLSMKQPVQQSYILFRHYMGFLDCAILDVKIYQSTHREIVAALLYLILLKQHTQSTYQRVQETKLVDRDILEFQSIYRPFVELVFGMQFSQLSKAIRFMSRFITLEVVIDQPGTSKIQAEKDLEEAYEYFLSIQTHNSNNLQFIRK
ncbi:hypothetical protein pb186bvf_006717 [Paramecium bursaria]